jgi:alpha-L-rhamnosidase
MTEQPVAELAIEHRSGCLVVGTPAPRLSWKTATTTPDWRQSAHEIRVVAADGETSDAGWVDSDESVLVPWPAAPLASRERRTVQVRVRGTDGSESAWSEPASVEAGLLHADDWRGEFVGPSWDEDPEAPQPCPYVRRSFELTQPVTSGRVYVSGLGVYELELNGRRVGDHVLAPGWTTYDHHLRYDSFDVTPMLRVGENVVGGILGDGWFRGALVENLRRNRYGTRVGLLCQLELEHADGSTTVIVSDAEWRASTGPIRSSGLYEGEHYDARAELGGWSEPGYDDGDWQPVEIADHDLATLRAPVAPPIRVTERVPAADVFSSPSGKTIVDFGQNLVGVVELTVRGEAGTEITIRHAEVLEDGELCTAPLRAAEATDRYVLRGGGAETWHPRFTFHGFRYAEITGWRGELDPADVTALVLHSDMRRTGWFECSDERVNQLHRNVVWGMRGNFVGIPTDCPQRDERLGWTGDIGVFAPTATYLYDCAGVLGSWLRDLAAEQRDDGTVPWTVPDSLDWLLPAAVWGDAAVTVPSTVHERYGDRDILRAQYRSMREWVELELELAGDDLLWTGGFQFADWLDPTARSGDAFDQRVDPDLLATAAMIHSLDLLSAAAGVLGESDDHDRYTDLTRRARDAFSHEYVTPNGRLASDSQTAYALAVVYDLAGGDDQIAHAGARLAHLAVAGGLTIATGFVGTPLVCDALTATGHVDSAYGLLLQEQCPSWLYPVIQGATTIWERWDAITPEGRVNQDGINMISFNHYALGAVADWLHRVLGGLAPDAPGWRELRIAPEPGGGLTRAVSRLDTPYGLAASSWEVADGSLTLEATVPPNSTARVRLPGTLEDLQVGSGTHTWTVPYEPPGSPEAGTSWGDATREHDAQREQHA